MRVLFLSLLVVSGCSSPVTVNTKQSNTIPSKTVAASVAGLPAIEAVNAYAMLDAGKLDNLNQKQVQVIGNIVGAQASKNSFTTKQVIVSILGSSDKVQKGKVVYCVFTAKEEFHLHFIKWLQGIHEGGVVHVTGKLEVVKKDNGEIIIRIVDCDMVEYY